MSVSPLDFFEAMTSALEAITRATGGKVSRCTNPEGEDVFVHLAPNGDITQVKFSGDAVTDLTILKMLVAPSPQGYKS